MAKIMRKTTDRSIAFVRVDELLVVATGTRPITDVSWQEYLDLAATEVQSNGAFTGLLLWWPVNAPSSAQRSMLVEKYAEKLALNQQRRAAVVAESMLIRGAMTAIAWFSKAGTVVKPFSPKDPKVVIDWLAEDLKFDRPAAEEARVLCIAECSE